MPLADVIEELVGISAPTAITGAFFRGWEASAPRDDFPLAQRTEILDDRICPLCRWINGKIVRRTDPQYKRFLHQLHTNCRGDWVFIHHSERDNEGRPTQPDWEPPSEALIAKHGHFVAQPEKYAALNIPPRPTGRDVIFYRPAGQRHVVARWRDNLPDWAVRETLQRMSLNIAHPTQWDIPGDFELAQQILRHASYRGLIDKPSVFLGQARRLWPGAALSTGDLRALTAALATQEETAYGPIRGSKPPRWAMHNPEAALPDGRSVADAALIYSPQAGAFVRIDRIP